MTFGTAKKYRLAGSGQWHLLYCCLLMEAQLCLLGLLRSASLYYAPELGSKLVWYLNRD